MEENALLEEFLLTLTVNSLRALRAESETLPKFPRSERWVIGNLVIQVIVLTF